MANKELTALSLDALKKIRDDASKAVLVICEQCATIRVVCTRLAADESVKGGDGEEILSQFAAISKAVENVSADLNKLAKALGMKEGQVEELMSKKFSSTSEESASALEKSSRLKKM